MFYVVCYLYAPSYQEKFQVGVNLLGNKTLSDSDSDSDSEMGLTRILIQVPP